MARKKKPTKPGFANTTAIQTERVKITPEHAKELLAQNTNNRRISRGNISFLKRQILEGKWKLNGESIKIAPDGELLDGQHRLTAIAESGKTVESLIVYNVPADGKHTMDTGKNRGASDVLSFHIQSPEVIRVAAAAKFVISFQRGRYGQAAHDGGIKNGTTTAPDNTDVLRFVQETPEFVAFVEEAVKLHRNGDKLVRASLFIGLYWLISRKSDKAKTFFAELATGIGVTPSNPVYIIRRKLIQSATSAHVSALGQTQILWAVVKIWNYWLAGDSPRMITYKTDPIKIAS